jgi:thioredoxin-like negative regulator of GroEL
VLEEVARDTPTAKIAKVNVDQNRALAARHGVSSLPTLMVFQDGQVIARQTGAVSKNRLKAMLDLWDSLSQRRRLSKNREMGERRASAAAPPG